MTPKLTACVIPAIAALFFVSIAYAQPPNQGGGPFGGEKQKLLKKFDANNDSWLSPQERADARKYVKANPVQRRGFGPPPGGGPGRGPDPNEIFEREDANSDGVLSKEEVSNSPLAERFEEVDTDKNKKISMDEFRTELENTLGRRRGGPGGRRGRGGFGGPPGGGPPGGGPGGRGRGSRPEATAGKKISREDVSPVEGRLYDPNLLRTIFIQFENDDWESELEDFHNSDVDVPATLIVDGKEYPLCGIRFRGASSYGTVPTGYKRSFNVSLDMADEKQRLDGYKTLNLLNCNGDDSMMSTVLYSELAGKHLPVPKANFVRVVVNGENWGIYTNVQQFNKDFLREHFASAKGARWKVNGSPRGGGGLDYRGLDPERYGNPYDLKNGDEKKATEKLIELCRLLAETPSDQLESAINDKVAIEGLIWFLAYDVALCNSDGYWIRASDYSIFLDANDRFHFFPHDMNEAFRLGGGGGGRGGRQRSGPNGPDPLVGLDDALKPLRSKILTVPKFQTQYLENIKTIAEELKWENLGPVVAKYRELIADEVKSDTRKLGSFESFVAITSDASPDDGPANQQPSETGRGRGGRSTSLRQFSELRGQFLLKEADKAITKLK